MKTAEEIMKQWGLEMEIFIASSHYNAVISAINEAREQYANQEKEKEAIAFHDWCVEDKQIMNYNNQTTEQLYQLYKQQK